MSDWISVKEGLPEDGTRVLTYSEKFGVCIAVHHFRWATDPLVLSCHPTHWMPLPDPPKEVERSE
jgi:hypothetical protein